MTTRETSSSVAAPAPVTHERVLVVYGALLLVMLLAALDSTIVATALPTIVGELGDLAHLSWVVTAYLLAQTVVTPLYGKLGDLYGRKRVLQAAVVIFLVGSALCGASRSLTELIAFRALQGVGGGGLAVTVQAVIGDLVPPRDRGRYQGIIGAVFGVSSVAGPLLGGYLTTHLSWRWIFYVNLPLGALALAVIAVILPATGGRARRAIDFAGAALRAVALSGAVLACDLGGAAWAWTSPPMLALLAVSGAALAGFAHVERRAEEPVLPPRLFRNRAFVVSAAVTASVGFSLFGSVTYVPVFFQVVSRMSPTRSGLQMLPMMGAMLLTSVASGQVISRTGRYKVFPLVGTAVVAAGLLLLSRMDVASSPGYAAATMFVLGTGLGMVTQVLVIAVQNAADYRDLGVATSGVTLFRSVGASVGTAALGAVFASRLSHELPPVLGDGHDPRAVAALPEALHAVYARAYAASLDTAFLVATGLSLAGFAASWLLPERPLRASVAAATEEDVGGDIAEAFAMPSDGEALPQLMRGLTAFAERDEQRRYAEGIVARAGVSLSPAAAWLLARVADDPALDPVALGRTRAVAPEAMAAAAEELRARGLVVEEALEGGAMRALTARGREVLSKLVAARRARLAALFDEWGPEARAEMAAVLSSIARELRPDGRASAPEGVLERA